MRFSTGPKSNGRLRLVLSILPAVGLIFQAHALPEGGPKKPTDLEKVYVKAPPSVDLPAASGLAGAVTNGRVQPSGRFSLRADTAKEQETDDRKEDCGDTSGNPVVLYTGNKVEPELDFAASGEMPLYLQRTYNHHWSAVGLFGQHWISNFDYSLAFSGGTAIAWVQRPDGRRLKFNWNSSFGLWEEDSQNAAYINKNPDGSYTLTNEDKGTETYNAEGFITQLRNEQGVVWNFTYTNKYLTAVEHSSGRKIQFTWSGDQLTQVIDPAGGVYQYTYTANAFGSGRARLATAILPGTPQTTVTYHYEDARYPGGFTGKSFNGVRYSTFAYDASRRAVLSEHAGGVERYTFGYQASAVEQVTPPPAPIRPGGFRNDGEHGWCEYRPSGQICFEPNSLPGGPIQLSSASKASLAATPTTTDRPIDMRVTETGPLGRTTIYDYHDGKQIAVTGVASAKCPASYKERSYDAEGNPDVFSDFADNLTDFDYSSTGLLQKKVEAVGTNAQRTTLYEWDQSNRRPTKTTVLGDHETTLTYDTRGNVASATVRNLSIVGVANQSRTTNYSYTYHANGLKATITVDGPLSQDNVTYTYNAQGDLTSVTNVLGHTTSYTHYNAMGEPGRVTGPNGDVAEFTRDARGRLVSQKQSAGTGSATTSFTYDGAGNVASVTTPDGITTRYQYDAARRRIAETRPFGNGNFAWTQHSYDAASNVTRTEVSLTDYPVDSVISGVVESITHDAQWNWYAKGWACSTGSNASIQVQGYAEGGIHLGTVTANLASEPQVAAACQANGSAYRFQLPISLAQRQQLGGKALQVYGVSPRGGAYNQAIGNLSALTIPTATIIGDVAGIVNDNWNFSVQGWACSVGVNSPTMVHVFAGGPYGTGTYLGDVVGTLVPNDDVKAACQGQGAYWFALHLTHDIRAAHGGKPIYVHGISPAGQENLLISRSGTFTVPPLTKAAEFVQFSASPNWILNGEQSTVTAQIRNTGNYVWNGGVHLAWGPGSLTQAIALPAAVAPGQTTTLQWRVAPTHRGPATGRYPFVASMADAAGAWGPQASLSITVENQNGYCPPNGGPCHEPIRIGPSVPLTSKEGAN